MISLFTERQNNLGRRKGDFILLAFEYALRNDDLEVAAQLLSEYTKLRTPLPAGVTIDRRRPEQKAATVKSLSERLLARTAILNRPCDDAALQVVAKAAPPASRLGVWAAKFTGAWHRAPRADAELVLDRIDYAAK